MADDKYDFVPPDFDEDAFIHKEMVHYKTTVVYFVWALLAAAASWAALRYVFAGDDRLAWPLGLGVCAAFGLALKPLFARFADISSFRRADWFWKGFQFFMCWLAFFIVALNPPLSDVSPPQVMLSADPPVQAAGGPVSLNFLAAENSRTITHELTLARDGQPISVPEATKKPDHDHYTVLLGNLSAGSYSARVSATDGRGQTSTATTNFTVLAGDFLTVRLPAGNNLTSPEDEVFVRMQAPACYVAPAPCVRTVWFGAGARDGSPSFSVPFEYSDAKGGWFATAKFDGWRVGENTGWVHVAFMDHFQGPVRVPGNPTSEPMRGAEFFTLTVQPPADRHRPEVLPNAPDQQMPIPGYGLLGAIAALLGVAALVRRRA